MNYKLGPIQRGLAWKCPWCVMLEPGVASVVGGFVAEVLIEGDFEESWL